jgi:hypothetical protein
MIFTAIAADGRLRIRRCASVKEGVQKRDFSRVRIPNKNSLTARATHLAIWLFHGEIGRTDCSNLFSFWNIAAIRFESRFLPFVGCPYWNRYFRPSPLRSTRPTASFVVLTHAMALRPSCPASNPSRKSLSSKSLARLLLTQPSASVSRMHPGPFSSHARLPTTSIHFFHGHLDECLVRSPRRNCL